MTDTEQSAVATLRALLPVLEDGPVHCVELLTALGMGEERALLWCMSHGNPLLSLHTADDLCRECGYVRQSRAPGKEPAKAAVFRANAPAPYTPTVYETEHPTDERRAICIALVRARIAELEAKR